MATNNLGLEQPEYLSDGEMAVGFINTNMSKVDALVGNILCHEGEMLTYEDELLISVL